MMKKSREIKFRAWDKIKKIFLPTNTWAVISTDFNAFGIMIEEFEEYRIGEYFYKEYIDLSQFTGLYDKNGKEIYFDDLYKDEYGDIFKVIQMECGRYALQMVSNGYVDEFIQWDCVEIIGNIYENPELLKS